jgi:hypothetical protein
VGRYKQRSVLVKIYQILASALFLSGCASTQSLSDIKVPYESITSQAPALAEDVLNNINLYIKQNYECENWHIVNVKHMSSDGQMSFTKVGQIYAGIISETWNLNQCGSDVSLGLVMMSDGKDGSYIAIAKL